MRGRSRTHSITTLSNEFGLSFDFCWQKKDIETKTLRWSHFFIVCCPTQSRNQFFAHFFNLPFHCPLISSYPKVSDDVTCFTTPWESVCVYCFFSEFYSQFENGRQSKLRSKKVKMSNGFWRPLVGPVGVAIYFCLLHYFWSQHFR